MQTGGGESAVSLPPPHLPPSFIAYACRKIIHALQGNDWWVVVGVGGWDGVGRRRVLQRVVEMVTTTTGGDGDGDGDGLVLPFRHVVRMRKQEDEMEIRRRLEEKLISHFNNNNKELYTTLEDALAYGNQHSTLLVIEHDLSRPLSVGHIIDFGIVFRNVFLRVVAPATTTNWLSNDYKESFISDKFEGLSNGEAWDLLRHEANEIAGELHQQTQVLGGGGGGRHDHYSCSTDMIIMDCLLYTILFPTPQHPIDFPYYWWCEGLIIPPPDSPPLTDRAKNTITSTTVKTFKTFTEARNSIPLTPEQNTSVHYKKCTEVFHRVLDKLKERSIMSSRQNAPPYTIRKVLRSKVLKIATTLHDQYSATSKVRKKGRFIIQQDFPTQEQMEDVTRLSLQFAPVQECPQDPSTINSSNNCPSGTTNDSVPSTSAPSSPPVKCYCPNLLTFIMSSNTPSKQIQDDFFHARFNMPNLRVLDLSYCTILHMLPASITSLTSLRFLNLGYCSNLQSISPCLDLENNGLPKLEILDVRECPLSDMTEASFRLVPNLWLLLCSKDSLLNSKVLDLSNTKVETLPNWLSNSEEHSKLDYLVLINTKHLFNVDWSTFSNIPSTLIWDQCGCCTGTLHDLKDISARKNIFQMCVENIEMLESLKRNHPLWGRSFQEFHIHVRPCMPQFKCYSPSLSRPRALDDVDRTQYSTRHSSPHHRHHHHARHFGKREFPSSPYYKSLLKSNRIPRRKQVREYVEDQPPKVFNVSPPEVWNYMHICGVSTDFAPSIQHALLNIHHLQLCNCDDVKRLWINGDLSLIFCQVVKCQNMEAIFHGMYGYPDLQDLEAIELFHLTRLRTLYSGRFCDNDSFDHVRSVHVESCPRLVILFSSTPTVYLFQCLEELVIKSCAELTDVFGKGANGREVAPCLGALYLWDLPKLARVCDGHLESLKTLQVRGCAKLRELPLFSVDNRNDGEEPFKLNISAEVKWWENLGEESKKHINFKPWSPWK